MFIDSNSILTLKNDLHKCKHHLLHASHSLTNSVENAGQRLENRQYDISVEETRLACAVLENTVHNIDSLNDYLNTLESCLNDYLKCKYTE